jgi:hypothetical protein
MKTIFDFCPSDLNQLTKWFKSRLDWMPSYPACKSYFWNWTEGMETDQAKWRVNHPVFPLKYRPETAKRENCFELSTYPIEPITLCGNKLNFFSMCLVGTFQINEGLFTVDAEFSLDPDVVESIWFLSTTRFENGRETINPEFDAFETNTPGHQNEMSTSLILSTDPMRTRKVFKRPLDKFKGRHLYSVRFYHGWIEIYLDGREIYYVRKSVDDIPMYPIIWNAVCNHQAGATSVSKIYNLKFET